MASSLNECAKQAAEELAKISSVEEVGGFILKHKDREEYDFVPIKSMVAGTPRSHAFYDADRAEFGQKVLKREAMDGFKPVASIHTHPTFSNSPSIIDLTRLFRTFQTNLIYSVSMGKLARYDAKPRIENLTDRTPPIPMYEAGQPGSSYIFVQVRDKMWEKTEI